MTTHFARFFVTPILGITLLAGCGGGGGGGTSSSVTYTGVATEAVVTDTNAEALTSAALDGYDAAKSSSQLITVVGITAQDSAQGLSLPGLARLLAGMKDMALAAGPNVATGSSQTINGTCGGSATSTGTNSGTESNVNITGSITFTNFCEPTSEGNAVIHGTISFTLVGTMDNFVFTVSTSYLSIAVGGHSVAYSMNYTLNYNGVTATAVMTANYRAVDGKTYRIENYQVVVNEADQTVDISGKLYHPDYGYVMVSTPSPLLYSNCSGYYRPTSGALRVTGAGSHYAEFQPQGCSQYQICVYDGTLICDISDW